MDTLEGLATEALDMLLRGNDPVLNVLRQQLKSYRLHAMDLTGVGFFAGLDIARDAPRLVGNPSFTIGDVNAKVPGLTYGIVFLLHIGQGMIAFYEAYCEPDDKWPEQITSYSLSYVDGNGEARDFEVLRRVPGWPTQSQL